MQVADRSSSWKGSLAEPADSYMKLEPRAQETGIILNDFFPVDSQQLRIGTAYVVR